MTQSTEPVLLDARDIKRIAPVSDMSLWRWIKAGLFPRPIKISGRNFWLADEIDVWLASKAAERTAA